MNHGSITPDTGFYDESACSLADFAAHTAQKTNITDIPNAIAAPKNVPVYDTTALADHGPRGGHYRVVCLLQNFNPIKTRGVRGDGGTQGRTASVCGTSECADSHHA